MTGERSPTELDREESRKFLRALPGYPFLPCPICGYTGSCDHIGWERARAALPGLVVPDQDVGAGLHKRSS